MNKKQAGEYFKRMGGRAGLAERAVKICEEVAESGSYKRAIAAAGQLKAIAEVCEKADDYFGEIANRGYMPETFYMENKNAIAPILGSDGHFAPEHWEAEKKAREEAWYILYFGESCDGRGTPTYYGRTLDRELAVKFLEKIEKEKPYSFGHVQVLVGLGAITVHRKEELQTVK